MIKMKEKRFFHRVTAIAMAAALACASLLGLSARAAEGTAQKLDVGTYKGNRSESEWKAPQESGKIFAGWFEDDSYETPYLGTDGEAYAKFIDAKVLGVQKQLRSVTHHNSGITDIRFLTSVDSIDYRYVSFKVNVTGDNVRQFDLQERKAYSSVLVDGALAPMKAADVFGTSDAAYFVVHSITGIPNDAFGDVFEVEPYWCTLDGTIVYGTPETFSIRDILNDEIGEGEINGFDKAAGKNEFIKANPGLAGIEAIKYMDTVADASGVTKNGVVQIDLSKVSGEESQWPAVCFGTPLCQKPEAGVYDYVVFTMYVENAPGNLVFDYKNQENNELLLSFPVKKGWAEYWLPLTYFDYDKVAAGTQFFVAYMEGNPITQKLYIDDIRYEKRAEAEVTETTAEYMNFGDRKSLQEFGTVAGNSFCTWLEEFQGARGVIRMKQKTQWASFKGLTPKMDKEAYAAYGEGDYFIIKVYKANLEQNVTMYYKLNGQQTAIGVLKDGWNHLAIDASVVLNNWDAFANGDVEFFASLWDASVGDVEITHDLYFDAMYFQKPLNRVDFIDFSDQEHCLSHFATVGGQEFCSYMAGGENAIRYQAKAEWPNLAGFVPAAERAMCELLRDGNFVIEMDVASYSDSWGENCYPKLYFKDGGNVDTEYVVIDHTGKYTVEIPAAAILDNWDAVVAGTAYFFFGDWGATVGVDCKFTGMYFQAAAAE